MSAPRRVSSTAGKRLRIPDTLPLEKGNACTSCRARKVRCDAGVPTCGACLKTDPGVACEYGSKRPRRRSLDYATSPLTSGTRSASSARAAASEQDRVRWKAFVPPGSNVGEDGASAPSSSSKNTTHRQADAPSSHRYTPIAPAPHPSTSSTRLSTRSQRFDSLPTGLERPSSSTTAVQPFYSRLPYDLDTSDLAPENYSVYDPPPYPIMDGGSSGGYLPDQSVDQLLGVFSTESPVVPPVDTTSEFERLLLGRPGFSGTRVEMDPNQQMYGSWRRREGEWEYRRDGSGRR